MPVLVDPANALPEKHHKLTPSQIIMLLLYPVIFVVGLSVGLLIGLRQGQQLGVNQGVNQERRNASIVPNINNIINSPTTNSNVNVSNLLNTNATIGGGDYLKLTAAQQSVLNQQEQAEKEQRINQNASLTDVVRQQDVITLKYRLKAYQTVSGKFPSTKNVQIHLDRSANDVVYQALKKFYGGNFNEPIDPEFPTYYYGYRSDGNSFEITTYLVSQKKAFIVKDS